MHAPGSDINARLSRSIAAVLLVVAAGTSAAGADGGTKRNGGLVPGARKTREELVREWDLNSDGRIDQGEAEVASSRMRRERAELRLNSGIDPLTGLPRGEESEADADPDAQAADEDAVATEMPDEEPAVDDVRGDDTGRQALPGTRAPRPNLPGPAKPAAQGDRQGLNAGRRPNRPAQADRAQRPLTGGARAGGVPARAGYGSGVPSGPLNAGLPIVPRTSVVGPSPTPSRGGLLPAGPAGVPVTRPAPAAPTPPRPAASREVYNPY